MSETPMRAEDLAAFRKGHWSGFTGAKNTLLDEIERLQRELSRLQEEAHRHFVRGQESVKRRNESGCCCKSDDGETIISACAMHEDWLLSRLSSREAVVEEAATLCDQGARLTKSPMYIAACEEMAKAIRKLSSLSPPSGMPGWVAVNKVDQLPADGEEVLLLTHTGRIFVGEIAGSAGIWWTNSSTQSGVTNVTHWMPLPSPPTPHEQI